MQHNPSIGRHSFRRPLFWLWLGLAVAIIFSLLGIYLFYLNSDTPIPVSWGSEGDARNATFDWLNMIEQTLVTPLIAAVLGILIVRQRPRHPIGLLLIAMGFYSAVMPFFQEWAFYSYFTTAGRVPGWQLSAWFTNWAWIFLFTMLLLLVPLFPTGTFLSHRWRVLVTGLLALFTIATLLATNIETPMTSAGQIPNPLVENHSPVLYSIFFTAGVTFMILTTIADLAAVLVRFRRSQGRERQQMKWLLAAMGVTAVMVVGGLILFIRQNVLGGLIVNASILPPLAGIGVALLRHRLYDIDIIIRRTVLYTAVSALLLVIYFGSALLLQQLLSPLIGHQSDAIIVFSTLLIAALFTPLRRRIQNVIDSRFYRKKYDAQKVLAQFAQTARDEVDMGALQAELLQVVQETLRPEHVSLWIQKKR